MKVLHVISSMFRGGRERQLATIYKYSSKEKITNQILIFNKINNTYISEYKIHSDDVFYLTEKKPYGRLIEIKNILVNCKPDIIYTWGNFEFLYCFLLKPFINIKIINGSIRHGKVSFKTNHITRFLLLRLSKYIVANSKAGLKANKLKRGYVLYNGIDNKFLEQPTKNKLTIEINSIFKQYTNEQIFISVANLVPIKDYYTTLRALKKIKDKGFKYFYIIIGEGEMRDQLEEELKRLELTKEVKFLGSKTNVLDYLLVSDVFIHSSKGEGCSNAILEAMAAGLPILATDTGGTSEIMGNENGELYSFGSVLELTNAIERLISDKNQLENKGKESKAMILKNFTVEKMIKNYISILKNINK